MENWHGGFKSNGIVNMQDVALPAFATQRKIDMQLVYFRNAPITRVFSS